MNEMFAESLYFGMVLSLGTYAVGFWMQKKWKKPLFNPLLISVVLCIAFLTLTGISYETYQYGAKYITYFLTPVTVVLAVPLYRQFLVLKRNLAAVAAGVTAGCLAHAVVLVGVLLLCKTDRTLILSVLPKSITTAIALGVSKEAGGIVAVTVVGVMIAGLFGAIAGPSLLKILHVEEPVAQGLAMGSASHAVGTSRAIEMGEIQAAMSSLAIVVTGLLTVILVPVLARFL